MNGTATEKRASERERRFVAPKAKAAEMEETQMANGTPTQQQKPAAKLAGNTTGYECSKSLKKEDAIDGAEHTAKLAIPMASAAQDCNIDEALAAIRAMYDSFVGAAANGGTFTLNPRTATAGKTYSIKAANNPLVAKLSGITPFSFVEAIRRGFPLLAEVRKVLDEELKQYEKPSGTKTRQGKSENADKWAE